jgi:hypothetical protein
MHGVYNNKKNINTPEDRNNERAWLLHDSSKLQQCNVMIYVCLVNPPLVVTSKSFAITHI